MSSTPTDGTAPRQEQHAPSVASPAADLSPSPSPQARPTPSDAAPHPAPTPTPQARPTPSGLVGTDAIAAAANRLRSIVRRTPTERSERLSAALGHPVYLKREDIQVCRSYKVRGAYNLIAQLPEEVKEKGVVAASAGNHAQGVAFACRNLGIRGTVFLPASTPRQKRERIAALGGEWVTQVISGAAFDDTAEAALAFSAETGARYVPPFDNPDVVAGQGTVGAEILGQLAALGEELPDTIVVPVGGAGLLAGVAAWVKENSPRTRILGVEPAGAASLQAALAAGEPVSLPSVDSFVDGAAVRRVGDLPLAMVQEHVDAVVSVSEGAVCSEMLELYQVEGIIAEPAGALASAALRESVPWLIRGPVVCIVSGGNNDVSRYADVLERSLVHEGLRHYFLVTFPQQPGALRSFLDGVLTEGEDIVLFEYMKKTSREIGPALVGIDLDSPERLGPLLDRMSASPLAIEKLVPDSPVFEFLR